jgi:type II restriction enzyme
MQAAFRAQNPCAFERGGEVLQKKNAYIFDFAPERTLAIYDEFANNLNPNPSGVPGERQDNIRRLLNFFPVIGEDSEGRMVELDASQVLTFPKVFKAREVVRRGFLSNLLFNNVAGIFRYAEHYKGILEKMPKAKSGKLMLDQPIELPEPLPDVDKEGIAHVDLEAVINPKVTELGKPVWSSEEIQPLDPDTPRDKVINEVVALVNDKLRPTREKLKEEYGLTSKQDKDYKKATEAKIRTTVERQLIDRDIAENHLKAEQAGVSTETEARDIEQRRSELNENFKSNLQAAIVAITDEVPVEVVTQEETKKEQVRANTAMDDARAHLRGFSRTIPMFLMAYGDREMRLSNFDDYTPDDVFEEITGITEEEFRSLRDGQEITEVNGDVVTIPGLFDETVFNQSIQEFLDKKEALADYFDTSLTENIFAYIPQQKTSLVFTPQHVVAEMVDELEASNPGIFTDSSKTFADLFSTAGLFVTELVRRLNIGLAEEIPEQDERLRHILTQQVFEMSHNEILHRITIEAVSGGVEERKRWMAESGHYRVGNLANMSPDERQQLVNEMMDGRN